MGEHIEVINKFREHLRKASMILEGKVFTKEEIDEVRNAINSCRERVILSLSISEAF